MVLPEYQVVYRLRGLFTFWLLSLSLFSGLAIADPPLIKAAQQLQKGFYRAAFSSYELILIEAQRTASVPQQQLAQTGLGHTLYLLNQPQQAVGHLQQALALSNQSIEAINGQVHYYLALVYGQLKEGKSFESHWVQAMGIAKDHSDYILQAYLHLASIKWARDVDSLNQHFHYLHTLLKLTKTIPKNWGVVYLNAAEYLIQHRLLGSLQDSPFKSIRIRRSYEYLQQAQLFLLNSDYRLQAQISGLQGLLYETEARYQEALTLSVHALQIAQKASAQDLQMLYEWQSGRLYKKLGDSRSALDSYRRAISHVEAIRQDIPVQYQDGKSSFKELLGPLYRDLADLVLLKAQQTQNGDKQILLSEARGLLEQLKQTELEDFFQDRCLIQARNQFALDKIADNTAILYPVLLENRFEWLIGIKGQLLQVQINQPGKQISQKIRQYTADLRYGLTSSDNQILYQLLFKPVESILQQHKIKTLVYIPDGVLRLLPLSVLSDGEQYLIERYAIATLPGLNLLNARTQINPESKSLLVGLSQPSVEVVSQLPTSLLSELTGFSLKNEPNDKRELIKKTRSASVAVAETVKYEIETEKEQNLALNELAKALALPGVATEIKQLAKKLPNQTLLNQQFTLNNFQKEVVRADYNIVHIASHGFFSGESKDSFIMTYNKLLTIDKLEDLLRGRKQNNPINLLTLSACQTAEGDDRAPLGLSGVAIKANAQTALGSLWPISDEAAVKVMTIFYQQLIIERQTKAKALQIAQQQLINDPELKNPFFWAPFILVGHWL